MPLLRSLSGISSVIGFFFIRNVSLASCFYAAYVCNANFPFINREFDESDFFRDLKTKKMAANRKGVNASIVYTAVGIQKYAQSSEALKSKDRWSDESNILFALSVLCMPRAMKLIHMI